jgi:hypothetical protein
MTTPSQQTGDAPHPHRAGRCNHIVFLVTGPEAKLMAWQREAATVVELFDRRAQTVRCRAHGDAPDRGQDAYCRAVQLAREHDVTLQDLVDTGRYENSRTHEVGIADMVISECVTEHPVAHLGSDEMLWPDYLYC